MARPLHDRLIIRFAEMNKGDEKVGLLYVPDSAKERPLQGTVVSVGAGRLEGGTRVPLEVKVGDQVLVGKYSGQEIKIDGELLHILREDEVLVIL